MHCCDVRYSHHGEVPVPFHRPPVSAKNPIGHLMFSFRLSAPACGVIQITAENADSFCPLFKATQPVACVAVLSSVDLGGVSVRGLSNKAETAKLSHRTVRPRYPLHPLPISAVFDTKFRQKVRLNSDDMRRH
jgi:hypothetical protein